MKSIFNGTISFGMVNVPIKLFAATEDHDLKAHQVHAEDHGKIRYHRVCEECNTQVDFRDIAKAFEYDGETVILTEDDLPAPDKDQEIAVKEFVPMNSLNPLMFESSYFVGPADKKTRSYILLVTAMQKEKRIAIVEFILRSKRRIGALTVVDNQLVLHALRWADEIREPDFPVLEQKVDIAKAELDMAVKLIQSKSADFDHNKYQDTQQIQLQEVVAAKAAEGSEVKADPGVSDLLARLAASVEQVAKRPPIREWCKAKGVAVSARGRIPKDIVDLYEKEFAV